MQTGRFPPKNDGPALVNVRATIRNEGALIRNEGVTGENVGAGIETLRLAMGVVPPTLMGLGPHVQRDKGPLKGVKGTLPDVGLALRSGEAALLSLRLGVWNTV